MSDWCLEHPVMTFLLAWIALATVRAIGVAIAERGQQKEGGE